MELRDYLRMLRRGWATIAVTALVVVAVAGIYGAISPKRWEATTALLVSTDQARSVSDLEQGAQFATRAATTYAQIVDSVTVLGPVAVQLRPQRDAEDLVVAVSVTVPSDTSLINITAEGADPGQAAALANATAASAEQILPALANAPAGVGPAPAALPSTPAVVPVQVRVRQIRRAVEPVSPATPGNQRTLTIGLLVGLTVGLATTIIRQSLDTRVRTGEEVGSVTELPVLGVLPRLRRADPAALIARDEPDGRAGEAFRTLRTNLRTVESSGRSSFVFAAVDDGDDTALALANLAWTLAQDGRRILVVDFDLRHGRVAETFGLAAQPGLSDMLAGRGDLAQYIQSTDQPRLHIITAGSPYVSPSDLLRPPVLADLARRMEQEYDCVLLNAPPVLVNSDTALVASMVGGAVLSVMVGRTRLPRVAVALRVLEQTGARPLGLVLTGTRGFSGLPAAAALNRRRMRGPGNPPAVARRPRPARQHSRGGS